MTASSRWGSTPAAKPCRCGVQPADVDLVIAVSCTAALNSPGSRSPNRQCLGIPQAGSFDLHAPPRRLPLRSVQRLARRHPLVDSCSSSGRGHRTPDGLDRLRLPRHRAPSAMMARAQRWSPSPSTPPGRATGPVAWGSERLRVHKPSSRGRGRARRPRVSQGRPGVRAPLLSAGPPQSSISAWAARRACYLAGVAPETLDAIVSRIKRTWRITESIARAASARRPWLILRRRTLIDLPRQHLRRLRPTRPVPG